MATDIVDEIELVFAEPVEPVGASARKVLFIEALAIVGVLALTVILVQASTV